MLPNNIETSSPTSLQQQLARTGSRLLKHADYYWLMAEATGNGRCIGTSCGGSMR